jgi:hypothetical protein
VQHVSNRRVLSRILKELPMTRSTATFAAYPWARLWVDTSFLMADAAMVMSMRMGRMMIGGRAAEAETGRMLSEKVEAGFELAGALASGRVKTPEGAARKTLDVYGKRIRANRRRLG